VTTPASLADATRPRGSARLVEWLSSRFGPVGRRDVLVGTAVVGSALATDGKAWALKRQSAYATICGPGNTAASGWTIFCATINGGRNSCPPGSFAAGWWRAAGSSWCGGTNRYIVDCNASCSKCTSGCADNICDRGCWSCGCTSGSTATCDQRRNCCNAFRYGQCNTQVRCSGGVKCRVVSCSPPYEWENCNRTDLVLNQTAEHSSPLLPQWGNHAWKYHQMGDQRSWLKASAGPVRSVGDGRGSYVKFAGGYIYDTPQTDVSAVSNAVWAEWARAAGTRGPLRYPRGDQRASVRSGGVQTFEGGVVAWNADHRPYAVHGPALTAWRAVGSESGVLGYPVAAVGAVTGGSLQRFETGGVMWRSGTSTAFALYAPAWSYWVGTGGADGPLGLVTGSRLVQSGGWVQACRSGWLCQATGRSVVGVWGAFSSNWVRNGGSLGPLGWATTVAEKTSRGSRMLFTGGQLWQLGTGPARAVVGALVDRWNAEGGPTGPYGYPVEDTVVNGSTLSCEFEGGRLSTTG
jgi:hypothetical protein